MFGKSAKNILARSIDVGEDYAIRGTQILYVLTLVSINPGFRTLKENAPWQMLAVVVAVDSMRFKWATRVIFAFEAPI